MKRMWKCYRGFAGSGYRLLVLGVLPALYAAGNILLSALCGWEIHMEAYTCSWLAAVEIMADFWVFSGICAKNAPQLAYMKSSCKGPEVIRDAAAADVLRRFLWMAGVNLICWGLVEIGASLGGVQPHKPADTLLPVLLAIFLSYGVSTVGIVIGRYFGLLYIQGCITSVVLFLSVIPANVFFLMTDTLVSSGILAGALAFFVLLAAFVSVFAVWDIVRKVRDSYYDK